MERKGFLPPEVAFGWWLEEESDAPVPRDGEVVVLASYERGFRVPLYPFV